MWFDDLKHALASQRGEVLNSIVTVTVYMIATQADVTWPSPLGLSLVASAATRLTVRWPETSPKLENAWSRSTFFIICIALAALAVSLGARALMGLWSAWLLASAAAQIKWSHYRELRSEPMRGWWPEPIRARWLDINAGVTVLVALTGIALIWSGDAALWLVFATFGRNGLTALGWLIFTAMNRDSGLRAT